MKQSAGILVYRRGTQGIEVLLAHPGGPFWAKKDQGAWSIPKGEFEHDEDPLVAAKREFKEEIGKPAPEGELLELGTNKSSSGKLNHIWAVAGDMDVSSITSNYFKMEWPPHSGQQQEFPEVDRAQWFELNIAGPKLYAGQEVFLERLAEKLGIELTGPPEQTSLL